LKSGNMQTASVIAVERYSVDSLLKNEGTAGGSAKRFEDIGTHSTIINSLVRYRLRENQQGIRDSTILEDTVDIGDNVVTFSTVTNVPIQDPEKCVASEASKPGKRKRGAERRPTKMC